MDNAQTPVLSVVVAIVSDTTESRSDVSHLTGCLEALAQQIDPPVMEIIVPYHSGVEGIEELKLRDTDVVLVPVDDLKTFTGQGGSREHHDELRAHGLAAARGEIIALLEDVGRPNPSWCARVVEAHQQAGESLFVSDANVSYKGSALESVRPIWQRSFHEPEVNWALTSRGEKLALAPEVIVYQHRSNLRLGSALKERYIWGRSYAATRSSLVGAKRLLYAVLTPVLPAILLFRITRNVTKKGRTTGAFIKALPLTALLTVIWSWGELIGYLTGSATN
jgi:hypothetical protein